MASLYVAEYPSVGRQQGDNVPVAFATSSGPIAEQKIAIGGASVAGVAFNTNTRLVRLHADAICSFLFGPVATVTAHSSIDPRMAANQTEYYAVQPNGVLTVAVITNT